MTVRLNDVGYRYARELVAVGRYVLDDRDACSVHQPSAQQENDFIARHGIGEYRRWHLGIDDELPEDAKGHYTFPYGDFARVHRCEVLSVGSRAAQRDHFDIESAAAHLHGMLDALKG